MNPYELRAEDFTFAPYKHEGDSGAMLLATAKSDPSIQYIVKSEYPEIACNEFMYHHVAAAVGLYTQDVWILSGLADRNHAVAIRYVPNARKFTYDKADEESKQTYFKFKTLYAILNEDDSEEIYYDGQGRLFKLDNAASFNMSELAIRHAINYGNDELPEFVWKMLKSGISLVQYEKYALLLEIFKKYFGKEAVEIGYAFFEQFVSIDISKVESAAEALEKIYPFTITEYYPAFVNVRVEACKRFISENGIERFLREPN